ncbi:MAG: hypothetical protein E4H27_06695 [Anaerolineales bacterium]|nr:MAG: hypothetical protein E4H27_06695 [Anaerolineales bacterium]
MELHLTAGTWRIEHRLTGGCLLQHGMHRPGTGYIPLLNHFGDGGVACPAGVRAHPEVQRPAGGVRPEMVGMVELHHICLQPPHGGAVPSGRDENAFHRVGIIERHAKSVQPAHPFYIIKRQLRGKGPIFAPGEVVTQSAAHQHRRHIPDVPALNLKARAPFHHQVNTIVGVKDITRRLVPELPLRQFDRCAPCLALVLRPDDPQVARLPKDIECVTGGEGTGMHERECGALCPRLPAIIGRIHPTLPGITGFTARPLDPRQFAAARSPEVQGGDEAPVVQAHNARAVGKHALRIRRFIKHDIFIG